MKFDNEEKEDLKDGPDVSEEDESSAETSEDNSFKQKLFNKLKPEDDNVELDKALKENEELTSRHQRLQADFSNYKKRVEKEKESLISYGAETLAVELLPVLDNFERALETENDKEDQFFKGIDMIHKGLVEVLNKNNIKEIEALNKPFNPEYHHAVGMENTEEYDKDTVIRILQKGYIMNEKVIRPAMVIVSQ